MAVALYKILIVISIFWAFLSAGMGGKMQMIFFFPLLHMIGSLFVMIGLFRSFKNKYKMSLSYVIGFIITTFTLFITYNFRHRNEIIFVLILNILFFISIYFLNKYIVNNIENPIRKKPRLGSFIEYIDFPKTINANVDNKNISRSKYYGIGLILLSYSLFMIIFSSNFILLLIINEFGEYPDYYKYISLSFFFLFSIFLGYLYQKGKKLSKNTADIALTVDPRDSILWLRSFSFDILKTNNVSSNIFNFVHTFKSMFGSSFEEEIVTVLDKLGPVVALGNINNLEKPLGAYRIETTDDTWKEKVDIYAQKSKYIVIVLQSTPSLLWEINELPKLYKKNKFIFLIPPYSLHSKIKWSLTWNEILKNDNCLPKLTIEEIKDSHIIGFYFDENNEIQTINTEKTSDNYYLRTLNMFVTYNMNSIDKEIDVVRKSSKESWLFPTFLFMNMFITVGELSNDYSMSNEEGWVTSILNMAFILLGLFFFMRSIFAKDIIKKMFKENIRVGLIMNIIVMLMILLPFLAY